MIVFEKLRWKNFLSTGNNFTEINLEGAKTNLIVVVGESGDIGRLKLHIAHRTQVRVNVSHRAAFVAMRGKSAELE